MPIQVQTPDGNIAQFPDGMSDGAIQSVLAKEYPAPKSAPAPKATPQPNTYSDVLKSAATGLAEGGAGMVGFSGDVSNLLDRGMDYLTGAGVSSHGPVPGRVTSGDVNRSIQSVTGDYHKPETTAGKYAETIASFAPAAIAPGGIAARVARAAVPGAASEAAGQLTEGTDLEPYARVAGAIGGGIAGTGAIRSINALAVNKGLRPLINPEDIASQKLRAAVQNDGGPETVGRNTVDWANSGASGPTLVDVSGNNVSRLVRAAAGGGKGQAQNIASDYAGRVRANFQDTVLDHTAGLTPDITDSATVYGEKLAQGQKDVAAQQYAQPYSQPAAVTKEMVSALQGPEGRGAINRAYAAASANRNEQQLAELSDLRAVATEQGGGADPLTGRRRSLEQALGELSAGTLDRVRIAMRETGVALVKNDKRDIAGGYFGRVKDIDTALDQTPGLQDARGTYRQMQSGRDAVDLGLGGLSTPSADYATQISRLASVGGPTNVGRPAQVGMRQALVNKLETGADGATGPAKTISQSARVTNNMGQTFGPERTGRYQTAVGNEVKRVNNADYISPNTGSQTEPRGQDTASLISKVPHSLYDLAIRVVDTIRGHGAPLTEGERAAIVRMGTTEADLSRLVKRNPNLSRAAVAQLALSNSSQRN